MTFTFSKSHKILISSLALAVALTSPAFTQDKAEGSKYIGETAKNLNIIDLDKIKNKKLKRLFTSHPDGQVPADVLDRLPGDLREKADNIIGQSRIRVQVNETLDTSRDFGTGELRPNRTQQSVGSNEASSIFQPSQPQFQSRGEIDMSQIKNKKLKRLFTEYPDGQVPADVLDRLPGDLREKADNIIGQSRIRVQVNETLDTSRDFGTGELRPNRTQQSVGSNEASSIFQPSQPQFQSRGEIDMSQIKNKKLKRLFTEYPDGNIPLSQLNELPDSLRQRADQIRDGSVVVDLTGPGTNRPGTNQDVEIGIKDTPEAENVILLSSPKFDGYVLTHEHPTVGMSFGGNYAFAGAPGNYIDGIMENGYTAACGGCDAWSKCDHAEVKGNFTGGKLGIDMGNHGPMMGPLNDSFSHIKYSTEWTRSAFSPSLAGAPSMKLMVAFALDNEPLCETLYYPNKDATGPGGAGHRCTAGDSKASMDRQISAIKVWAKRNKDWMEIAYSSADAKRIISDGKLAIIIGVESDYAWGAEDRTFDPVNRLNHYYDRGVRTFYLAHKVNSRLAGADIYGSEDKISGQAIRVSQAIANCFYVDDSVSKVDWVTPNGKRYCTDECDAGEFHAGGFLNACQYKYSGISEANMLLLLKSPNKSLRTSASPNGFVNYPKPSNFNGSAGSRIESKTYPTSGQTISVERNNLGLSRHGENVIREAMKKGMIMNLDHISSRARDELYDIAMNEFDGYPLNALHNIPNDMSIGSDKFNHPHEYDMDPSDIDKIAETKGVFGVILGPRNAAAYPASGVTLNCPETVTESAKFLAYLLDKDVSVGYSLDLATVTKGALSRTEANCSNTTNDKLVSYKGHTTNGLTHIGTMENFHAELKEIGLKKRYRTKLEKDGLRNFLKMWERSEAKSIYCQADTDCPTGEVCRADVSLGSQPIVSSGSQVGQPIVSSGSQVGQRIVSSPIQSSIVSSSLKTCKVLPSSGGLLIE